MTRNSIGVMVSTGNLEMYFIFQQLKMSCISFIDHIFMAVFFSFFIQYICQHVQIRVKQGKSTLSDKM